MTDITYRAIRERIETTAQEIIESQCNFPTESSQWETYQTELETLMEEAHDNAQEEVDSWDWVIYTYKGFQVFDALNGQEQREAESLFEDIGGYQTAADMEQGPYEIGCAMAYLWLAQELASEIQSQCEELIELCQNNLDNM